MLLINDIGLGLLLDIWSADWANTYEVGLFNSPHTPVAGDTYADYLAIEATFPGYSRQVLQNWTSATLIGPGFAQTEADIVTFTRGAGAGTEDIYGYFVVDASNNCIWAEEPPWAPITIDTVGQSIAFLPRISLQPA